MSVKCAHLIRGSSSSSNPPGLLGGGDGEVGGVRVLGRIEVLHLVVVEALCQLEAGVLVPVILELNNLDTRVRSAGGRLDNRDDLVKNGVTSGPIWDVSLPVWVDFQSRNSTCLRSPRTPQTLSTKSGMMFATAAPRVTTWWILSDGWSCWRYKPAIV